MGSGQGRSQEFRGWFGQGRLSGKRHYAGHPINALTGKMILRFFVVCATVQGGRVGGPKSSAVERVEKKEFAHGRPRGGVDYLTTPDF